MRHLKKIFIAVLGLSNILVLGLIFNVYFGNQQKIFLFSLSEDLQDLKNKIQEECAEDFSKVLSGDKSSFICRVTIDQSHKGASYKFKAQFRVSREEDSSLRITEIVGKLRDKKAHVTEADFCNDCFNERNLEASNLDELMTEVTDVVETMYDSAQESVEEAFDEEQNLDSQSFKEFTQAGDRMHCRLNQINQMESLIEIEQFYHGKLKKHLWNVALSDEEKANLDQEIFDSFHSPYRYSLSVRSSMALLEEYTRWEEDFDILQSLAQKQKFLREISKDVNSLMSFMSPGQLEQDLYYLNKGFDGLYKQLDQTEIKATAPIPVPTGIDYDSVAEEVKSFY